MRLLFNDTDHVAEFTNNVLTYFKTLQNLTIIFPLLLQKATVQTRKATLNVIFPKLQKDLHT